MPLLLITCNVVLSVGCFSAAVLTVISLDNAKAVILTG